MTRVLRFVDDGIERHEIALTVLAEQAFAEVEAEYAEQFAAATFWQRIRLRRLIRQEVARRLPKPPSPYNLYGRST
jgi:hypothetical protein